MAKQRKRAGHGEGTRPAPATRDDFLLKAFADVAPLPTRNRLAPRSQDEAGARPALQELLPSAASFQFVVERDADYVSGYRADLGAGVLATLRSSRWRPQDTLDLHGYRTRDLEKLLVAELRRRVRRGVRHLLIVHGKGLHSAGGIGVLGSAVVESLTEGRAAAMLRALMTAPLRLGGSGALAVELEAAPKQR